MSKIDTSIEGYKHIGIKITQEQLNELSIVNSMMQSDDFKDIPVHCILLVLKNIGLLPAEMILDSTACDSDYDAANNSEDVCYEKFQKSYGKFKD